MAFFLRPCDEFQHSNSVQVWGPTHICPPRWKPSTRVTRCDLAVVFWDMQWCLSNTKLDWLIWVARPPTCCPMLALDVWLIVCGGGWLDLLADQPLQVFSPMCACPTPPSAFPAPPAGSAPPGFSLDSSSWSSYFGVVLSVVENWYVVVLLNGEELCVWVSLACFNNKQWCTRWHLYWLNYAWCADNTPVTPPMHWCVSCVPACSPSMD
jgi:hypothetical protein